MGAGIEIPGVEHHFMEIVVTGHRVAVALVERRVEVEHPVFGIVALEKFAQVHVEVRRERPFGEQAVGQGDRDFKMGVFTQGNGFDVD